MMHNKITFLTLFLSATSVYTANQQQEYTIPSCSQKLLELAAGYISGRTHEGKQSLARETLHLIQRCPGDFEQQAYAAVATLPTKSRRWAYQCNQDGPLCKYYQRLALAAEELEHYPDLFFLKLTRSSENHDQNK